jgi:hypothetical protein
MPLLCFDVLKDFFLKNFFWCSVTCVIKVSKHCTSVFSCLRSPLFHICLCLNFFLPTQNFSLFAFCFLCWLFDSCCSCQIFYLFFFAVVVLIFFFHIYFFNLFFLLFFFLLLFWLLYFLHVYFIFSSCYCPFILFYFISFYFVYKLVHELPRQTNWLWTIEHFDDLNTWRNVEGHLLVLLMSFTR